MVEVVLKFVVRFQVSNTERLNSRDNTYIIAMVSVKDSYDILSKILGKLQKGIQSLKEGNWRNKKFCLFLFGDYNFFFANLLDCQGQTAPICIFGALQHQKKCNKEWVRHFQERLI